MLPHEPQNRLLALLPGADRARLLSRGEPVQLDRGQVVQVPGEPTSHVLLPQGSVVALIARVDTHPGLAVGLVGAEGMVGGQAMLGSGREPVRAVVQGAGQAWRLALPIFRTELAASLALRRTVGRYLGVLMTQRATAVGCLRYHEIGPRLARWLLMSQDRARSDSFSVTHEALAGMLGVRRVGITVAAGDLQRQGLIAYRRGEVRVLDRHGLQAAACSCYAADREVYAREMGAGRSHPGSDDGNVRVAPALPQR